MMPTIPPLPQGLTPLTKASAHFLHETMDLRTPTSEGEIGLYFLTLLTQSIQYDGLMEQYDRVVGMQNRKVDGWVLYQNELQRFEKILEQAPWNTLSQRTTAIAPLGPLQRRKVPLPTTCRTTISWDQRTANYQVYFWLMEGKAPQTWELFCEEHNLHPYFRKSKKFRQHLFGLPKFHPNAQSTWQHIFTSKLSSRLEPLGFQVLWLLPDELGCDIVNLVLPSKEFLTLDPEVKWRSRMMTELPLDGGGYFRLVTEEGRYYKTLVGVGGPKFVPAFVKHVLGREVQPIDLIFKHEGRLATWVD